MSLCPYFTTQSSPKLLNVARRKQCHTIAQGLQFSDDKGLGDILMGLPSAVVPNTGGMG